MSFLPQETDPLLANPSKPSKTQNPPTAASGDGSSTTRDGEQADLEASEEQGETMGTYGLRDTRKSGRKMVDNVSLGCIVLGLLMFLPLTWYITLKTNSQIPGGLGPFVWHPTMQSLGITVAVLSIQSLQSTTSPAGSLPKKRAFTQHRNLLLILALPSFLIGVSAMWYNKQSHGAKHFTTWHGKMGLSIFILILIQALIGSLAHTLSATYGPRATKFYKYHRASGYVLLPLILVTAHLGGAWSDWSVGHSSLGVRVAAFDVGLGLVAVGVVGRIRLSKMKML